MDLKSFLFVNQTNQCDLAKELGVTPACLSMIVCRKRRPHLWLAKAIEIATGGHVTRMELLYPEEYPVSWTDAQPPPLNKKTN